MCPDPTGSGLWAATPFLPPTSGTVVWDAHANEILGHLDELKGVITSTYGSILKLDSTKKVSVCVYMSQMHVYLYWSSVIILDVFMYLYRSLKACWWHCWHCYLDDQRWQWVWPSPKLCPNNWWGSRSGWLVSGHREAIQGCWGARASCDLCWQGLLQRDGFVAL